MWFNLLLIAFGLLLVYLRKNYCYWRDRGVPGPDPVYFFGNMGGILMGNKSVSDIYAEIYTQYKDYPFVGMYRLLTPVLMIREPELVKNVMVKDFKSFHSNDFGIDEDIDGVFGRNPFSVKGMEWKTRRAQLSTLLTSAKIKIMYPVMEKVSHRMVKYIRERCKNEDFTFDSKEVAERLILDIIASSAMGVEGNCFTDEFSNFRKLGKDFTSPGTINSLKSFLAFTFPFLGRLFRFRIISREVEHQLIHMVREIMEDRRKNNIVRNDFLDSVSQLYNSSRFNEEIDIIAHVAAFFLDAYESTSLTMSFALYNLAGHPDCQSKLREEISRYCEKSGGRLDYDMVQELPYLQACIYESIRMMPVLREFLKVCTERYTYTCTDPDFKNISIDIEQGTSIILPIESLQKDFKYFEEPEKYIPERFLNNCNYNKMCFLPFGGGPRTCVGMQFGMTQVKLGVAQIIIRHFELAVNIKTKTPLKYDKWYFELCPIGGLWLDFKEI